MNLSTIHITTNGLSNKGTDLCHTVAITASCATNMRFDLSNVHPTAASLATPHSNTYISPECTKRKITMCSGLNIKWRYVLGGWGVYALYMSVTSYVVNARLGRPITWSSAVAGDFSYSAVWVLLTPVVLLLVHRYKFEKGHQYRVFLLHLGASVLIALLHKSVHGILFSLYRLVAEGNPFSWELQYRATLAYFDYGIQVYWILLLLNYLLEYYDRFRERELRASQLEAQLVQSQLNALKMQLQPHFLFNTLNAISVLIKKNPDVARTMVGKLSDLLRFTLENVTSQETSLRIEMDYLERYLSIEKTRFEDRLTVKTSIPAELLDAQVPTMILQPLVENAIKHGVAHQRGHASIEVHANRNNGTLSLQVIDNGKGLPTAELLREGVGLTNTRARLNRLYGSASSLELSESSTGGVVAKVTIPWHEQ
ncbi:MAG TPA: histidine kinase [Bacteroidota bacterium]